MAKVTFLIEGSRAGTITVPVEIEGENGDRLLNWVLRTYAPRNEDGSPAPINPQFSVTEFVSVIIKETLQKVENAERQAAIEQAVAAITPIEVVEK